jgi:hypothetical protein
LAESLQGDERSGSLNEHFLPAHAPQGGHGINKLELKNQANPQMELTMQILSHKIFFHNPTKKKKHLCNWINVLDINL